MKRKIKLKNVKGSYDYAPREQRIRNYIQDTLKEVFEEYGYKPLETPILCYYDLLAGKYDEANDILNEIYKLRDQKGRRLGLRYDLTVPFAKYIAITKDIRLPFKRYEIGKVFRNGPVKTGRDREFLQCDVDVVGLDGNLIEAELISLWLEGYSRMNIDVVVKYNSRNLMRGVIEEVGITEEDKIDKVVTIIDKIDKMGKEELLEEFKNINIPSLTAEVILEYFTLSLEKLESRFATSSNEMLKTGLEELRRLEEMLDGLGLKNKTVFSPSLARGQDYYTGNVFEVYAKNGELSCSLGGGGRYDRMITDFIDDGNSYPAVGVSFGLSTIYEILKSRDEFKNDSLINILIIPYGTEVESLALANKIRKLGVSVEVDMTGKKLKKSFEFANRENIPYVIVLGETELEEGRFNIKNMETGEENSVNLNDVESIKEYLITVK